jgi:hypothetical protein
MEIVFFLGAAKLVEEKIDALTLRQKICDHLQDNEDYYSPFLTSNSVLYSNEVSLLRTVGTWTDFLFFSSSVLFCFAMLMSDSIFW